MTETTNLAQALAILQTRLPKIEKSQTADVPTKNGGSYKYTYADLAQITRELMPILGELGLSFTARPTMTDDRFVLAYKLMHVSGEFESGEYPLPTNGTPQAVGSAITYARRYCLCAVTGVAPEDDDGAAAQAAAERPNGGDRSNWRAAPPVQANGNSATASKPQLQKLHVLFSQAEWTDKGDRLRAAAAIVGRPLESSTQMTRQEASKVIDTLTKVVADPDPAERLTEIVSAAAAEGA